MTLAPVTNSAATPNASGTSVSALNTESFFIDSRTMNATIMANASRVSIYDRLQIYLDAGLV